MTYGSVTVILICNPFYQEWYPIIRATLYIVVTLQSFIAFVSGNIWNYLGDWMVDLFSGGGFRQSQHGIHIYLQQAILTYLNPQTKLNGLNSPLFSSSYGSISKTIPILFLYTGCPYEMLSNGHCRLKSHNNGTPCNSKTTTIAKSRQENLK